MKVVELVKICGEMMKMLHENGISMNDYKHLPMLSDYITMKADGNKTTYSVTLLSEKYKVCERKIYKLIRAFLKDC